jgi:hypothetical protein
MKKFFIGLCFVLTAVSVLAQERAGNVFGKVVDSEGVGLPGVTVTLKGSMTAPMVYVTTSEGIFRFLSLPPAMDYAIRAELQGFKTKIQESIKVTLGNNINLVIIMEMGSLQEEVTVTAKIPLLDAKKTTTVTNIDKEVMQSLPTARDTLGILEFAPSVAPNKVFTGDSNIGMMNNASARGIIDTSFGVYSVDGQMIEGSYWDMDQWEEVQIKLGGTDVTNRTGNLTMNMVTKRGGNNFSFGGRFHVTDEKFQGKNLTDALKKEGVQGTDRIVLNKDYGFNFGGPFVKDKAWFWAAYGVQDSRSFNVTNTAVNYVLTTYNAKLNLQLMPQNRLEIWGMMNEKLGLGRDAGPSDPVGLTQRDPYHFGRPTVRIGDEHMFGDSLFVSLSALTQDAGLILAPGNNEKSELIGIFNQGNQQWQRRANYYGESRPRYNLSFLADYFNDKLFGFAHEIKAGFAWEQTRNLGSNINNVVRNTNFLTKTIDMTGDGLPDVVSDLARLDFQRWSRNDYGRRIYGGHLSDTLTKGVFTIILGLRYDRVSLFVNDQPVLSSVLPATTGWKTEFTPATADVIDKIIPTFTIKGFKPDYGFGIFSPRLGIVWNVGGTGRTLAKLSLSQYANQGLLVDYWTFPSIYLPLGSSAWANFWWMDKDKNQLIDFSELYWHDSKTSAPYRIFDASGNFIGRWTDSKNIMWGSFDPFNPTQLKSPSTTVDKSAKGERVTEATVSVEHELSPNLVTTASFTYCIFNNYNWTIEYWPDQGKVLGPGDYLQAGIIPAKVGPYNTGDGAGQPYYLLNKDYKPSIYSMIMRRPDYDRTYYGLSLIVTKRMSNNWMLNGSLTLQNDAQHFGSKGYLNPNEKWAFEGTPATNFFGRWMAKLQGLYLFPWDINFAMTFFAREGWIMREYITVVDYNAPNPLSRSARAYIGKYGNLRLKPLYSFSVRLEKRVVIADKGKIYVMMDLFNLFNLASVVRRNDRNLGTYYPHDNSFVPNPQNYLATQILNPISMRLGIRFQF